MSSSVIGYIILALICVIMLMSILFGLKRGASKSAFRLVWLLVTGVILWFLTPVISSWLNSIDISSLGLDINGPVSKLSDIGVNILNSLNLDEAISQSEAVRTFAENFPTMILNVLVFVLGFWVLKILLYPIWAIIASKCFDKKKRELKAYKRKIKNLKKRGVPVDEDDMPSDLEISGKNRFGGMLVGIVMGFVICVATLSPIVGLNAIYQKANANLVTQNEAGEEVPYLPTVIDEETQQYLNSYEDSVASKVAKYTGISFFSNLVFDGLATVNVGGEKIYLASEVDNGIYLYNKYTALSNFLDNKDNCTKESVADALSNVKDILFGLKGSKLVDTMGDDLLPYFMDKFFAENEDLKIVIDGQDYAELFKTAYKNSTLDNPIKVDMFMNQIDAIIDIATLFNDNGLMVPIIKGEASSTSEMVRILVQNNVNAKTFSSAFVDNLFKVTLLSSEYPTLVDSAVEKVFEGTGISGYQKAEITENSLSQNLKDILENFITYLKLEDKKTDGYFANEDDACDAYGSLGKVVDVARSGLLSESSYNGLLDYLKSKANEMLGGTENEESKYSAILNSLYDITVTRGWEAELRSVAPVINTVMQIKNEETDFAFDKILSADYVEKENDPAERIGNAIQKAIAGKSVLITNYNIKETLKNLIDDLTDTTTKDYLNLVVDTKLVDETQQDVTLKDYILGQIWAGEKTNGRSEIKNWGNEFKYSLRVLRKAMGTLSNFDKTALSDPENKSFENLGLAIDEAMKTADGEKNTHLFVENKVLRALINNFLEKNLLAKEGEAETEIDKIMAVEVNSATRLTVKESVLNNIYLDGESNVTSWEAELGKLKTLFVADFGTSDLVKMGELLDDISGSEIFTPVEVRAVVCYYIDREATDFVGGDDEKLELINAIKNNVSNVTSYEKEILNLTNLMDTVNKSSWAATPELTAEQVKFGAIGRQFDLLSGKKTDNLESETTTESKLLTNEVLQKFLKYYVKDTSKDLEDGLKNIVVGNTEYAGLCANMEQIVSYETEFVNMAKLVDVAKDTSKPLVQIGKTIDGIKENSVPVPSILSDIVVYYVNENVPDDYASAKTLIKNKLKPTDGSQKVEILSYEREFGYMAQIKELAEQNPIKIVRKTSDDPDAIIAGELFNQITSNPQTASVILTRDVIAEVIKIVIDKQLATYNDMGDELKAIVKTIGNNAANIVDYEMEFKHMDTLLTEMNNQTVDVDRLGGKLDAAEADGSKLFDKVIIKKVLDYFFNQKMKTYIAADSEYKDIASKVKAKALEVVDGAETGKYEKMFAEVISLKNKLDDLQTVSTYDEFKANAVSVGQKLDDIASMQWVADEKIAKDIASIAFDKMKTVAEEKLPTSSDPEGKGGSARVDEILNNEKYAFNSHATDTPQETYTGDTYYADLMTDIQAKLTEIEAVVPHS